MQTTIETLSVPNLKSKELEEICIYRMQCEEIAGLATMSRYGVQGSYIHAQPNGHNGNTDYNLIAHSAGLEAEKVKTIFQYFAPSNNNGMVWQPMQSLPDFEGVLMGGRQFCFDAKVCSQASFPLAESTMKERQLRHLKKRALFGAICFFLIHFNARQLKTKSTIARTIAFPVHPNHPFWEMHERGEVKRITEQDCELYGVNVSWNIASGKRKISPDVLQAIHNLK